MVETTDRVERLLALVLIQQLKGASQRDKILQLNLAGFSNVEIADILQTTTATVAQSVYEAKRKKSPRKARS